MAKKKPVEIQYNPNWKISYTYIYQKDEINLGDLVKFKGERGSFKFVRHVENSEKNVEWIDCVGDGGYRSFYVHQLKGKIKVKKTRKNKID